MEAYSITDLQFGSTGKGALAGYLAKLMKPDTLVTAWMPNAGHTYVTHNGTAMIHTMLANGVVSPKLKRILIAPATVLDVDALMRELSAAFRSGNCLDGIEVLVHENATILQPRHSQFERDNIQKIGSTQKGSGAAIIDKLTRDPQAMVTAGRVYPHGYISGLVDSNIHVRVISREDYLEHLYGAEILQIEGAQGYSLGIHSGFYPYTTSRECTVAQLCSDTLFNPQLLDRRYGCLRLHPIRVANRTQDNMVISGWSGPHYPDQDEISFEEIGQETEYTTVTKLPRRIYSFSRMQVREAALVNGIDGVFMNFCNYIAGRDDEDGEIARMTEEVEELTGAKVLYRGWGPKHQDIEMVINVK